MFRFFVPTTRAWLWLAALWISLVCWARPAHALAVPPLRAHVNDNADMLSPAAEQQLEQTLTAYEQKTGQQFALLTVPTLEGDAIDEFSIRVAEAWKLGKKGKDDGLLLLIARDDRLMRIEVGYGLEGDVTDVFTAQVRRNVLQPALRAGQADQGIVQAFRALMQKASGQVVDDQQLRPAPQKKRGPSAFGVIAMLFILLPFLLPLLFGRGRGGGGGGGAAMAGWILGSMMSSGRRSGGWGGGGGGWGGGGGGWGGGGGGFSGGGGGFGGGGSSGSW